MATLSSGGLDTYGAPEVDWKALPMAHDRGRCWGTLREAGRVVSADGWYLLTHREDVLAALRSPGVFSSKAATDFLGSPFPLVPIAFDPPEHTRYRKILQPFFSPGTLHGMEPSLRAQVEEMVDVIAAKDECEAMSELAVPYPSRVFLTLFGLPVDDLYRLIAWKDAIIELTDRPTLDGADLTTAMELFAYLTEAVNRHRQNPGHDILSQLVTGEDALNDTEALGLCFLFVLAGLDTVTSAIGSALLALAVDRQLRERLRKGPEQVGVFIEEIFRLEPPAPVLTRVTTEEVTIGDITLPAGSPVKLCIGSVNRDESDETSVNEVVMDGKVHRHWGFGGGPHRCLGSHLARMEMRLVVTTWLDRIGEFEVVEGCQPRIAFPANTFGLKELPLRIGRR